MMKKLLSIALILILLLSAAMLASCGENIGSGKVDDEQENAGSLKIGVEEEDGSQTPVGVDEDTDLASYVIVRDENASSKVKSIVSDLRKNILDRTGVALNIKTTLAGVSKGIVVQHDTSMGSDDYSITEKSGKIYVRSGSEAVLETLVGKFTKSFIYAKNKSILVPAGKGYAKTTQFYEYIGNVTVDGVAITDFEIMFDTMDIDTQSTVIASRDVAKELSYKLICADGSKLGYTERKQDGRHYIIVSSHSPDLTGYTVEIKDGNVYVSGSVYSIEAAADAFLTEVLESVHSADEVNTKKTLNITSADNISGNADYSVPYTKDQLIAAINHAYNSDDMIIVGSHTTNFEGTSNGTAINKQIDNIEKNANGEVPAFIEFDLGSYSKINKEHEGETGLSEYELSRIISESAAHVEAGGIIGISAHLVNPVNGTAGGRGTIGNDYEFKKLYTEGTKENENLIIASETVFTVLKAFADNDIPVLFRPFHEMTGDWFWWCVNQKGGHYLEAESYINLWKYYHNYVTSVLGCDNVVWVYSTACKDSDYAFPGNEYVDVVGCDWYSGGDRELNENGDYNTLMTLNAPVALTEFGGPDPSFYDYTSMTILSDLKWMQDNDMKISYILVWTTHGSLSGYGKATEFFEDPITYSRADMMKYWQNN